MTTPTLQFHPRQSALVSVCLLFAIATNARAETFPLTDVIPNRFSQDQREMLQSHAQKLADGMFNHLLLLVDEIDRVCHLSEPQIRRFTIAAKGAVQLRVDEFVIDLAQRTDGRHDQAQIVALPGRGLAVVRAGNVAVGVFGDDIVENRAVLSRANTGLLNVVEQELWKRTIERTLTDEQFERYENAQASRKDLPKEWRHERVMVAFDEMLRLDSSQRGPLEERVEKFLEMSQIKLWLKRRQGFEDDALARMALRAIPADDVEDFLSERQLAHWKMQLRLDLESR